MGVTMDDIAKEAGVSKATVSRVINDDSVVKDETREKVMKLVKKYNYKPHTVASGLARNLSYTIALMMPELPRNISDPFFLEFLNAVGNKAAEHDFSLSLPTVQTSNQRKLYEEEIDYNRLDGLIATNPKVQDVRVDILRKKNIPFVFLGRAFNDDDLYWVDGDNIDGAYQATEYLINQGYEKIACLSGQKKFVASDTRLEGYKKILKENGLPYSQDLVVRGDFTKEGGYKATKRLLARDVKFNALFAINDMMAMGAIQALKEFGLKIPQDCAVIGFDGIDLGTYIEPKLSTVKQPISKLGFKAAEMLIKLINGKEVEENQVVLPVELLIRDSC